MHEFFPVLAGIIVGVVMSRLGDSRARAISIAILSIALGVVAATISGEIGESWAFVLFDTAQVAFASVVAMMLVSRWESRAVK